MKYTFSKKAIFNFFAYTVGIASFFFFAYTGLKMLPSSVSYSVPEKIHEEASISEALKEEQLPDCKYGYFSDIREKGPFTVQSHGNEIYVFAEDECLYHVKSKLSEFPEKDKNTISAGITAVDFSELCEILSYIES